MNVANDTACWPYRSTPTQSTPRATRSPCESFISECDAVIADEPVEVRVASQAKRAALRMASADRQQRGRPAQTHDACCNPLAQRPNQRDPDPFGRCDRT